MIYDEAIEAAVTIAKMTKIQMVVVVDLEHVNIGEISRNPFRQFKFYYMENKRYNRYASSYQKRYSFYKMATIDKNGNEKPIKKNGSVAELLRK